MAEDIAPANGRPVQTLNRTPGAARRRLASYAACNTLRIVGKLGDFPPTVASQMPTRRLERGRGVHCTWRGPIIAILAALAAPAMPSQPRPDELRFTAGTATFFEADQHATVGGAYRKYFGKRGWAVEPEYSAMLVPDHVDNMLILSLVKDLSRPTAKRVWYMSMGGGVNRQVSRGSGRSRTAIGALAWGLGIKARVGERWRIAPQVRVGFEPNIRFEVCVSRDVRRPAP